MAEPLRENTLKAGSLEPAILFVAGFGDGAAMFERLADTPLAERFRLVPMDLPGFAGTPPLENGTSLETLATVVHEAALEEDAHIVVAHSVASIIASLAARRDGSPIDTVISLEGNLTAEDAYFSGTAADYPNADEFKAAFLARLSEMALSAPIIARYRDMVVKTDPQALWELGCNARRFSERFTPGDVLSEVENVCYLYNPDNCPETTLDWLKENAMKRIVMENATHWKSVDQPEMLSEKILEALGR